MKIAGHTMGTPEYTLEQAVDLFNGLGLDGIEIVVQDGYQCGFAQEINEARIGAIGRKVKELGMQVSCLTPYYTNINSLDAKERQADMEGIEKVIQMAAICEAPFIRIYGGAFGEEDIDDELEMEQKLIDSMIVLGEVAKKHDVTLVIENHFHTMTTTALRTANIIRKISHPNVGILYDQANLAILRAEDYDAAIKLQAEFIKYVHVKDMIYKEGDRKYTSNQVSHINEDDRVTASRILGEGILPWAEIIDALRQINYDGWLSHEYERRWAPKDLPDAKIGMRKSANHLTGILNKLGMYS
jgi:L-ribulose-5-phosphate 3-epimerase